MVSRVEKKVLRSRSLRTSNEQQNESFGYIDLMSNIDTQMISKYIDYISRLSSSFRPMSKDIESCYVILISSLLVYTYSKEESCDSELSGCILNAAVSLSESLTLLSVKSSKCMKLTNEIQSLSFGLLASLRQLIKDQKKIFKPITSVKIRLLSKILSISPTTPFKLLLVSLLNLANSVVNSNLYPTFTAPEAPFLPEYNRKSHTLVLDLDETLAHMKDNQLLIRPGATEFIEEMSLHYELVLFTAASPVYADLIMSQVDPNALIKLRLYRIHTTRYEGLIVKNLETLGRDLSKVIIIDNLDCSFKLQPSNGILIKTWTGDSSDTELLSLSGVLSEIPYSQISHVSQAISKLNNLTLQ